MKHRLAMVAILAVCCLAAPQASADVLSLRGEVHAGGAGGKGVGGALAGDAFHAGAAGPAYGASVGLELLFIDVWVEHNQYPGADGEVSTWTQFMTGLDTRFDLGPAIKGGDNPYAPIYGETGMAIGFGVGTGQQVEPPLDNSEVTDKGFLFQVSIGGGFRVTRALSLGVIVPVQASYLFKSGEGAAANDQGTHYQSIQAAALLNLRLDIQL